MNDKVKGYVYKKQDCPYGWRP